MSQVQTFDRLPSYAPTTAKLFLRILSKLHLGHLKLITPDGSHLTFGDVHLPATATLKIHDWRACSRIIRAGDIGFAEALEAGWIESPDLSALLCLAIRNEAALNQVVNGGWLSSLWYRLRHLLRPNTREGSLRNIHAHYDIGNEFYQLWLDPSMTYSSALFAGDFNQSLQSAQQRKYQRIIDVLQLRAGDHVLEIGCGWGGFAAHAAQAGIRVMGITISPAQLAVAQQRNAGWPELVQLKLCDYRDLVSEYDAVVSIEMFEAVGEKFWPGYFEAVQRHLKPGGRALVQSITIAERDFERYRSSTDFIQQYIFPGGMLPSRERFASQANRVGLQVDEQFCFGKDYAETLRRWHQSWQAQYDTILAQGFDERFMRIWRLYFAYCEAGFDEGKTDVVQFLLSKN